MTVIGNVVGSPVGSVIRRSLFGATPNPLALDALTYDPTTFEILGVNKGIGDLANSRTSTRRVEDHEGLYPLIAATEPAWWGARYAPDPDKLAGTFTVSATSPDPLDNLRMDFNDGSTWRLHAGSIITENSASGSIETIAGLVDGNEISFFAGSATALTRFYCYTDNLTGSIPALSSYTALERFYGHNNSLTGSIPDLSSNTALIRFYCYNNSLTGSIPSLTANTALTQFYCYTNSLTDFAGGWPNKAFHFNASDNALTEAAVNQILIDADTDGIATGTTINLSGGTNAAPTGAGATAAASLISGGATVTTN